MRSTTRQIHEITTDEVRLISVDMRGKLDSGEVLSGTPTVEADSGSGLVLSSKLVNSAAITVNSRDVSIGEAVQFKADATAAVPGDWYVDITCGTDAGQTVAGRIKIAVVNVPLASP